MMQGMSSVRFGRLASGEEYQRIQGFAKQQGLDPARIDQSMSQVVKTSRIPVWNLFHHGIPNLKETFKTGIEFFKKLTLQKEGAPYAAFLYKYPTVGRADKAVRRMDRISANSKMQMNDAKGEPVKFEIRSFRVHPREVLTVMMPVRPAPKQEVKPAETTTPPGTGFRGPDIHPDHKSIL